MSLLSSSSCAAVAAGALALASPAALAAPLTYDLAGTVSSAENLAFAVINGNLAFSAPESDQLPLPFTGTLVVDDDAGTASLEIGGSYSEPGLSFTWDLVVPPVAAGVTVTDAVVLVDAVDGEVALVVEIDRTNGAGSFSFVDVDAVPTSPPLDRSAAGSFTATLVGTPACDADVDGSGAVDFADVLAVLAAFGTANAELDLDLSGTVGFGDVLAVLSEWGPC